MLRVIAHRPVAAYFALTFTISWGGALLAIGARGMMGPVPAGDPRFIYAVIAMLAGPSVASVALTALLDGRRGLRNLLARAHMRRLSGAWLALALLAAPVLWSATLVVLSLVSPTFASGIFTSPDLWRRILIGLAVAAGAGVFEEIGWTGFAIPRIARRHETFATGLIVGVAWGAWHVLTNVVWASRVSAGDLPLSMFLWLSVVGVLVGYLTAFRVLMVWVYERTDSLLLAMVMHASLTASVLILDPAGISGAALLTYSFALATAAWSAVAIVAAWNGWSISRPAPHLRRAVRAR